MDDREIKLFRIQNKTGAYIELSNYGATLVSFVVPDKYGVLRNIVLNYPTLEEYKTDKHYLGSTIGRVANRISGASFQLNGMSYFLDKNDGKNCNHSGNDGFNSRIFNYRNIENGVEFHYRSLDGEAGFPGNLDFWVTYTFTNDNELNIEYIAKTDQATPLNPTNHAYFNLSGNNDSGLNHLLQINAMEYLESDPDFIPTGRILPMEDSAYDFRNLQVIGQRATLKNDHIKGFNTYFVAEHERLATLVSPQKDCALKVTSSMPGILLYTGDYLDRKHQSFGGICLETQFYPDAPNQSHFPSCMLHPGKIFKNYIKYKYLCINK